MDWLGLQERFSTAARSLTLSSRRGQQAGGVKSVPWWRFGEGGALGPCTRSVYSMLLIEAINHSHGQLAQTGASFSFSYPEPKTHPRKPVGTRAMDVVTRATGVSLLVRAPPRCPGLSRAPDTVAGAQ